MSENIYSNVERLSAKARGQFSSLSGTALLTAVVLLSGTLSAIFFWQNSQLVFSNVWSPAALALGLLVGLVPAEGAFFGWKGIRASKPDMTQRQLHATTAGLVAAISSSIFSTLALFVASFEQVPAEIAIYDVWLVFLALSIPIVLQVSIYAYFAVNERSVIENHERAKLGAMAFNAHIRAEQARLQAIVDGMDVALDRQLEDYGRNIGQQEAEKMLHDGSQQLLRIGQQEPETREKKNQWQQRPLPIQREPAQAAETAITPPPHADDFLSKNGVGG